MARTVGLVVHGGREVARTAARQAAEMIGGSGAQPVVVADDGWSQETLNRLSIEQRAPTDFAKGLDVIVVFGGDGTFLRAAWLARDCEVPLVGVNLGRLGFLTEIESDEMNDALARLLSGGYHIEERMTLAVSVHGPTGEVLSTSWALNEASVERTEPQRLIVLRLEVGGTLVTDVPADALICATPTGSTAYAFSAGGPVLAPTLSAMVVVPVAPHTLFDRTLVVDPTEQVKISPVGGENVCVVSLDGRETLRVPEGGWVAVSAGEVPVRLARLNSFDFYERLRSKFRLT